MVDSINGYFDVKRDNALIAAGTHFWCETCIVARPIETRSPDYRYCQGCYEFLLKEAQMDTSRGGGNWKPAVTLPDKETSPLKAAEVSGHPPQIMSTVESKKIEVDIIQPSVSKVTRGKRGPKHKALPRELIKQWAGEGMGSKAIASKLRADHNVTVSYKTIQRILVGKAIM